MRFLNEICWAVFQKWEQVANIHYLLNTQKTMKMTGKKSKNWSIIFLPSTLLRLTKKVGETFHFLPFNDENSILGWLTLTPIIPEQKSLPEFFLPGLDVPRRALQHTQIWTKCAGVTNPAGTSLNKTIVIVRSMLSCAARVECSNEHI